MVSAGSSDQTVHIWDEPSTQELYFLPGHTGSVNEVGRVSTLSLNCIAPDTPGARCAKEYGMEEGTTTVADFGMLDFAAWCGARATLLVKSAYGELTTWNTNITVLNAPI